MYPTHIFAYVFMHIFLINAHLGISILDFFMRYSKMRIKRWMETQPVTALKYEINMFQKFITCLFDNSYISYMGLYIYALFF